MGNEENQSNEAGGWPKKKDASAEGDTQAVLSPLAGLHPLQEDADSPK